jgi:hypothetical protein
MKLKIMIIIVLMVLLVSACNVINSSNLIYTTEKDLNGEWTKRESPKNSRYQIITSKNKEELLAEWHLDKNRAYYKELKKLELKEKVLILAYLGEMPTGGYKIQIDKVIKRDEKILIKVKYVSPPADAMVTMVITYPFDLVLIDRSKFERKDISKLDWVVVNQNEKIINNQL